MILHKKKIEEIKDKIVKAISPEKIIFYGSYANGIPPEDSDVDLVVIWQTDLNPHKRNLFLSRLFPRRDFSLDISAFTKEEEEKMRNVKGTILYEATHNGRVIHGE